MVEKQSLYLEDNVSLYCLEMSLMNVDPDVLRLAAASATEAQFPLIRC